MGRKTYLFWGSDSGGEKAASPCALIGSDRLNGVDPERYLGIVLARIPEHPINRIDELLPWRLRLQSNSSSAQPLTIRCPLK
jgi:transposase